MLYSLWSILFLIPVLSTQGMGDSVCKRCPHRQYEIISGRKDSIQMYSPTTLIILYDTEIGKKALLKAVKRYKADLRYEYKMMPGIAIRKPDGKTIEETMAYFKKVKGVVRVMRDGVNYLH